MTTNDVRSKYLSFFKELEHVIVPSSSLVPENDPTTLFTGSGMQPIVPYLLGEQHPSGTRITDSQKCFRSQDIEQVGDNRHTTFFEMLGNWSFGDYFKKEQIPWMYEFLTKEIGLDPSHLYISCFKGDDDAPRDEEAAAHWQELFTKDGIDSKVVESPEEGMQGGRIFYYDETKNWWSRAGIKVTMPVGEPGGPSSEIFWDFGESFNVHEKSEWRESPCHINCDCGRFVEIGNNVFMAYKKTDAGFELLKKQNIDFGGGLERIAAAENNNPDMFMIDLFDRPRAIIEELSEKTYGESTEVTHAFRAMLDHLRAVTFLIGDGVYPSNKDQGYFARRLLRRAVRYGNQLGIEDIVASPVADAFIDTYEEAYPNLSTSREKIIEILDAEEKKFRKALARGEKEFGKVSKDIYKQIGGSGNDNVTGIVAKMSFDLYQTHGLPFEVFTELLQKEFPDEQFDENKLTRAYDKVFEEHQAVSRQGVDKKFKGGLADHSEMSIKYHTATHLLHAATLEILGSDAFQKGSNITPERLRFDFAYNKKLTEEQIELLEDLVNAAIATDYPVSYKMLTVDEAKAKGAIGLFEGSYGEQVKVYTVGDPEVVAKADPNGATFSREFCGGPHVEHTGVLGKFKIIKEEAVSTGVRRIRAIFE
jgi:alanyl-tRNA synthetase